MTLLLIQIIIFISCFFGFAEEQGQNVGIY